jgi:hypothetical protein
MMTIHIIEMKRCNSITNVILLQRFISMNHMLTVNSSQSGQEEREEARPDVP